MPRLQPALVNNRPLKKIGSGTISVHMERTLHGDCSNRHFGTGCEGVPARRLAATSDPPKRGSTCPFLPVVPSSRNQIWVHTLLVSHFFKNNFSIN